MNSVARLVSKEEVWERASEAIDQLRYHYGQDMLKGPIDEIMQIRAKADVLEDVRGRLRAQLFTSDEPF